MRFTAWVVLLAYAGWSYVVTRLGPARAAP
jgi:hypothetical protein